MKFQSIVLDIQVLIVIPGSRAAPSLSPSPLCLSVSSSLFTALAVFHGGEHNGAAGGRRRGACATAAASFVITLEMDEVSGDDRDGDDDRGEERRGVSEMEGVLCSVDEGRGMDGYGCLEWRDKSESPFSSTSLTMHRGTMFHHTHATMRAMRSSFSTCSALTPRRGATKPPSFSLFIERQIFRRWTGATGDSAKRPPSSLCTMTRGGEWRRGAALPFLPKPYRPICNALCPDSLSLLPLFLRVDCSRE